MEENNNKGLFDQNNQGGNTPSEPEQKSESSSDNNSQANQSQSYHFDSDKKDEGTTGGSPADGNKNISPENQESVLPTNETSTKVVGNSEIPTNSVGDSGNTGNDPKYPISEEPKKETGSDDKKVDAKPIVRAIVIIVIVALAIWFFSTRGGDDKNPDVNGEQDNQESVDITVDDSQEQGNVEISSDDNQDQDQDQDQNVDNSTVPEGRIKITAYFSKDGEEDCSQVSPLEREIEKKYDSEVVNTVRGLLIALSSDEVAQGFTTNIPIGTWLNNVHVQGTGVAMVDLSSQINDTAGSCAVTAVRAQIEQTLLQFPYVSSVVICSDSNCDRDQILQP